jgi:hypothetical protein
MDGLASMTKSADDTISRFYIGAIDGFRALQPCGSGKAKRDLMGPVDFPQAGGGAPASTGDIKGSIAHPA